jgi:very-short-patch-repair endonuclease
MPGHRHPKLTDFARKLRTHATDVEKILWYNLRRKNFKVTFRRQHVLTPYIVDFYCPKARLVIELDGGQHSQDIDQERTKFLESKGLKVIRFWNNDVLEHLDTVLDVIYRITEERRKE